MAAPAPLRCLAAALALQLAAAGAAAAGNLLVPTQFPTIQAAVDNAAHGDQIFVAAGVYVENVVIISHINLRITSTAGAAATVVNGNAAAECFAVHNSAGIEIDGFTITNGRRGIAAFSSHLNVTDCTIRDNVSPGDGGGLYLLDCFGVLVQNNMFRDNQANFSSSLDGGGVFWFATWGALRQNWFVDNVAHEGGGLLIAEQSVGSEISGNVFLGNQATFSGGAMAIGRNTDAGFLNNTIVNNSALVNGGGIFYIEPSDPRIENNIIVGNASPEGGGIHAFAPGAPVSVACNDVWDNSSNYGGFLADQTGTSGNISADPRFCAPQALDFALHETSPCAAANAPPGCGLVGAFGLGCVATALEPVSWGQIKARFK